MATFPPPLAPGRFNEGLGIWVSIATPSFNPGRPAIFLDRDGVIVEDTGYLCSPADMVLIPGAADVIGEANRRGILVIEVTNQGGIGRGYYGWEAFLAVEQALTHRLASAGAVIDGVFACPYHPEGIGPFAHPDHPSRKPRPGMFLAAQQFFRLDLTRSWVIGDKTADIQAGRDAGLRAAIHVLTGHGPEHRETVRKLPVTKFEILFCDSMREARTVLRRGLFPCRETLRIVKKD